VQEKAAFVSRSLDGIATSLVLEVVQLRQELLLMREEDGIEVLNIGCDSCNILSFLLG
jgi:hypothetical protein